MNPEYILMDEITSSLDVKNIAVIAKQIRDLRSQGVGVLLVTHMIPFARNLADHVVLLEEGRVVEQGPADLLANPKSTSFQKFIAAIGM